MEFLAVLLKILIFGENDDENSEDEVELDY